MSIIYDSQASCYCNVNVKSHCSVCIAEKIPRTVQIEKVKIYSKKGHFNFPEYTQRDSVLFLFFLFLLTCCITSEALN